MSNSTTANITSPDAGFYRALSVVSSCLAALSLLCGIILFYMCVRRVLHITRDLLDMLACLIFCEMIMEIGIIIGNEVYALTDSNSHLEPCHVSTFCIIQGFYTSYFNMASLQWTIVLEAICLWVMATNAPSFELKCAIRRVLLVVCWATPLIICIVALSKNAFGPTATKAVSYHCWITSCEAILSPEEQLMWMFLTGKALEIVAYLSVTNCFFIVFFFKRRKALKMAMSWAATDETPCDDHENVESTRSRVSEASCLLSNGSEVPLDPALRTFALIPLCYVATRAWGTVRFVLEITGVFREYTQIAGQVANEFFSTMQAVGDGSLITIKFILIFILRQEAREFCKSPFRKRRTTVKQHETTSYHMLVTEEDSSATDL